MSQSGKPQSPVTMRDVARAAGVSRMTVSRALRQNGPISRETREHVLKFVRDMNYVPDQVAGSLTTKRSGFVAALVPSLNNSHFAETIQSLTEELENCGRQILIGHTDYSAEREERVIETMLRRRPEALVLSYDGHSERTVRLLREARIPIVEMWERPEDPIGHTIGFSNRKAAAEMTRALIDLGYKDIVFLCEADDDWTRGAARRAGYCDAMREAGLADNRLLRVGRPPLSIEDGAAALGTLLNEFPEADCIFCVSDAPAFGVLSALKSRGLSVPDHMGVAGFGNFEVSRFASPAISTVTVDPRRIGSEAAWLIDRLLREGRDAPEPVHIDAEVRPKLRGSTRRQRHAGS